MLDVYKGVVPAPCQCPASSPLTAATPSICLNISPAGQCWCWACCRLGSADTAVWWVTLSMMTTTCALFYISFIPSFCFAEHKPNTNLTPWGFIWIFDDYMENLSINSAAPHLSRGGTSSPSSRTGVCSVLLPTGAYLGWSPLPTLHMYTDNTDMLVIMMAGGYTLTPPWHCSSHPFQTSPQILVLKNIYIMELLTFISQLCLPPKN